MTAASICVVGGDATMVYDAVHNVVANALGDLDAAIALEDFTVKDVTLAGETNVARVLEALNTPPFLSERRVVVVRDAQLLLADETASLLSWMGAPSPATILVLAVVGAKSHKLVKGAGEVVDVNVGVRAGERTTFVREKFDEYGVVVDSATAQRVAEQVGDDVARVDALARTLHSIYGSAPVSFARLEPYLGGAGDVAFWHLTDAIDSGDTKRAIELVRRMLESRQRAALQIVAILQRHVLAMVRLEGGPATSPAAAATLLGVAEFRAQRTLQGAQRLGPARLRRAVRWLAEADLALKGGVSYGGRDLELDLDPTGATVIEVLVARLARLSLGARRG